MESKASISFSCFRITSDSAPVSGLLNSCLRSTRRTVRAVTFLLPSPAGNDTVTLLPAAVAAATPAGSANVQNAH